MACDFDFIDSSTVTWNVSGSTIQANAAGGGGGCCNSNLGLTFDQNTRVLTATVTDTNGTVTDTVLIPDSGGGTACCNTGLNVAFDPNSGLLTVSVSDANGTISDSVSIPTSTGAGNTSSINQQTNLDGSITYTHNDGAGNTTVFTIPPPGSAPCTVTGPNGWTGTQTGVFVDACVTLPIADNTSPLYPESEYPAAGYPAFTRQIFTNGATGADEYWVVLADVNGVLEWHQVDG